MKQINLSHAQKKTVELRIHQPTPHFCFLGETIHLYMD